MMIALLESAAEHSKWGSRPGDCFQAAWIIIHHVIRPLASCIPLHAASYGPFDMCRCNIERDRSHHIPSTWCRQLRWYRMKHNTLCRLPVHHPLPLNYHLSSSYYFMGAYYSSHYNALLMSLEEYKYGSTLHESKRELLVFAKVVVHRNQYNAWRAQISSW